MTFLPITLETWPPGDIETVEQVGVKGVVHPAELRPIRKKVHLQSLVAGGPNLVGGQR